MSCEKVKQGDPFIWLARPGALSSGDAIDGTWVCKMAVYGPDGTEEVSVSTVTAKTTNPDDSEEYFVVVVSPAEVAGLSTGTHHLVIDISNASTDPIYGRESEVIFEVNPQRLSA